MQRPLHEHISHLEQRIVVLNKEFENRLRSSFERGEISIDIGIAERSLVYFKKAFELEQKLSR